MGGLGHGEGQSGEGEELGVFLGNVREDVWVVDGQAGEVSRGQEIFSQSLDVFPLDGIVYGQHRGEGRDVAPLRPGRHGDLVKVLFYPLVGTVGHPEGSFRVGRGGVVGEIGQWDGDVGL